jgi:hypothetical protein
MNTFNSIKSGTVVKKVITNTDSQFVYIYGNFYRTLQFYGDVNTQLDYTLLPAGNDDTFIAKYGISGKLIWLRRISGSANDQIINLLIDNSNNVYAYGTTRSNPVNIYSNDTTVFKSFGTNNVQCAYLVKYNSNGIPLWATRITGTSPIYPYKIVLDNSNNVIACGTFAAAQLSLYNAGDNSFVTINNNINTGASQDVFVVKYNSSGNILWYRNVGGQSGAAVYILNCDQLNNIYISGISSSSPLKIYNTDNTTVYKSYTLPATTVYNAYVVKYDSSGNILLTSYVEGETSIPRYMIIDNSNNAYTVGSCRAINFSPTINIYNNNVTETIKMSFNNDSYVIKYNTNSSIEWVTSLVGSASPNVNSITKIFVDNANDFYVCGNFSRNLYLYNTGKTLFNTLGTNLNNSDTYIVKYNTDGSCVWTTTISGTGSEVPTNILVDKTNNIYISGTYTSSKLNVYSYNYGSNSLTLSDTVDCCGNTDVYLVKYNKFGSYIWGTHFGGSGEDSVDMKMDSSNNIYLYGIFNNRLYTYNKDNTGNYTVNKYIDSSGSSDIYLIKYTENGNFMWSTHIGGSSNETIFSAEIDNSNNNNIYIVGYYLSTLLTFYNANDMRFNDISNNDVRYNDMFVSKYDTSGNVSWSRRFGTNYYDSIVNFFVK